MNEKVIYKIKDSIDLFITDEKFLTVYFMNTRIRKSFKINSYMINLLECLDGRKTLGELERIMFEKYMVKQEVTEYIISLLLKNRIITPLNPRVDILNLEDCERYQRQINYWTEILDSEEAGIRAQKKIVDSNVIIFGCGAIGGNIALELAMAGVGRMTLFDYDKVEKSDVARHMYYNCANIHRSKTDSLKEELLLVNPDIEIVCINETLHPHASIENLIKEFDFVVNSLDEPYIGYTSAKISRICVKYNIPHYIAGGFDAHLASTGELIVPFVTPCVECYATHFKRALANWKPEKHPVRERDYEIGGLASMSLFSASYACITILKYIIGIVPKQDEYQVRGEMLFNTMQLNYLDIKKNDKCPVCGKEAVKQ